MRKKQKQREEQVKREFRKWLEEKHSDNWIILQSTVKKPITLHHKQRYWSPDIDVLACDKDSHKLIAFEVKPPIERYKRDYRGEEMYQLYKTDHISDLKRENKIKIGKGVAGLKFSLIYEGIGEALFHLRWADQSFLVLPSLFSFYGVDWWKQEVFLHVLYKKLLPLGLIVYNFHWEGKDKIKIEEFRQVHEARNSYLWQEPPVGKFSQETDKLVYSEEIGKLREELIKRCLDYTPLRKAPKQ